MPKNCVTRGVFVGLLTMMSAMWSAAPAAAQDREPANEATARPAIAAKTWLRSAPAGGKSPAEARKNAKPGDVLVVRGVVSSADGSMSPDLARLVIVEKTGDAAEGPGAAEVMIIDGSGKPLGVGLVGQEGLGGGAEVIVVGKMASAVEGGPLVVHASGIHVVRAAIPAGLFLDAVPAKSESVEAVKQSAKRDELVYVRGRIGGSKSPFVEGRAVFTIVGAALKACSDKGDDHCKTPWDYCCDTKKDILLHSATVQVVDAGGKPLRLDLKSMGKIKELSDVTVVGKVAVAEGGGLVVNASGIFVHAP